MSFTEALRVALESLITNPLRSLLTLLGIVMGVTAIIAVVAIINGLNIYVQERIIKLGPSSFEVNRFGIITNRKDWMEAIRRNLPLRVSDGAAVKARCPLAEVVAMKAWSSADVRHGRKVVRSASMKGVTSSLFSVEPYDLQSGRFLTEDDDQRATSVAFIGSDIAEELFGPVDPIGKDVKLRGRSFEVIGVAVKRGSVFGQSRDNYVLIPLSKFQKTFGSRESIGIVVRARSPEVIEQSMDEVRVVLRARRHLRYEEKDNFGVVSSDALNALWRSMTSTIFQVALFVVGISLVVGGIVIMNIMLVSVIERTREIGVRKALGARHRDIRRQFLMESCVLASAGGLMGVGLAYAATVTIRSVSPFPAAFPWWAPLLALSISSAIGIFFGLYPAAKAARLNPIEALRSD
ncbi:MAG TPA: ABC transporter permease [Planctomycetota bacterium]|nr:ABC transporter permease [Planctomycetota bacterium]